MKDTTFAQKNSFGLVHRRFKKRKKKKEKDRRRTGVGGFSRHNHLLSPTMSMHPKRNTSARKLKDERA